MLRKRYWWVYVAMGIAGWGCTDSKPGGEGIEETDKGKDKDSGPQEGGGRPGGGLHFTLENKSVWGRDDALYVQINKVEKSSEEEEEEGEEAEEIDWEQSEVFAGEGRQHRARRAACPEGLPARPGSECFRIELSELPDLPHGEYELELTTALVNKAGKKRSGRGSSPVGISRKSWQKSWSKELPSEWSSVTTRAGLLVLAAWQQPANEEGRWTRVLLALNAQGEEVWRADIPLYGIESFLLGRHHDMDVLLASCWVEGAWGRGIQAFNADTGGVLSACENLQEGRSSNWALLQGGPGKDLVMVREIFDEEDCVYSVEEPCVVLEACRLVPSGANPEDFELDCQKSAYLPNAGSYVHDSVFVRQIPGNIARVYTGSLSNYWCATDWSDDNGWDSPCGTKGPDVDVNIRVSTTQTRLLGAEHMWVHYLLADNIGRSWFWQAFQGSTLLGEAVPVTNPSVPNISSPDNFSLFLSLVDAGDEVIAADNHQMRRYSASGNLLASRGGVQIYSSAYLTLLEGGTMVYPNEQGNAVCLKSDLRNCWPNMQTVGGIGFLAGVLPVSSTRSVVVFSDGYNQVGTLVDSPGLKKDAPWPISSHDLCRSYNISVPVDNCWDGPQS